MKNIVLVGFMGTGKTTVGRLVASRLDMDFVDMDDIIESRTEKKISRIFAEDGEPHFRRLERELVKELSARDGLVIATGGGVVLNRDNMNDYARSGLVVCLQAAPDAILARVSGNSDRPLLEDGEKEERILQILATRKELYDSIEHRVNTTHMTPDQVADRIIEWAS